MDSERILVAIYSFLFNERDRLESDVYQKSAPLLKHNKLNSTEIYNYWKSEIEFESFKKFQKQITEILEYYDRANCTTNNYTK